MVHTAALLMIHLRDKVATVQMCTQTFIQPLSYEYGVFSNVTMYIIIVMDPTSCSNKVLHTV